MYLSKLTTLLKRFNRAALTRLSKYVHSPYFQVYPPSAMLLDYLLPLYPEFSPKKITIAAIAKHSESLSTRLKQETAGTRLQYAIDDFIAEENWQQNKAGRKHEQLKGYKARGLNERFDLNFEKEMAHLNQCPEQDIDTFSNRHLLIELSHNGFDARLNRTVQNDIMPVIKSLDALYAIKKLRYLCEALNRKIVLGVGNHDEYIPLLLKMLKPHTNTKYPYVYLFVNVYRMLSAETYEDNLLYYRLIKQFVANKGGTPTMREVMGYAINQCLDWNNKGYREAGNEYLWWVEWRMKNNLLLENEKLMPVTFRNIIGIAVSNQKQTGFIEKLINTYSPYLPKEYHDTSLAFAKGLHQYALGNYTTAIRFLLEAQAKEDVKFNTNIRRWQWLCYYEADPTDTDTLFKQLDSFEKYLQRNKKELQHVAPAFKLFITYAAHLVHEFNRDTLNKHLEHLKSEEYFPNKTWLLEQFILKIEKTRAQGARVKAISKLR